MWLSTLTASGQPAAPAQCADASATTKEGELLLPEVPAKSLELHRMHRQTVLVPVTCRPFILDVSVTHQNDADSEWRGTHPERGKPQPPSIPLPTLTIAHPTFLL